jgi:IclR family pca regulon transcriptional regulator
MMLTMSEERSGDFIQSLERGLVVINSFSKARPAQSLSEVAQLTGLTRATVRRVLLTLAELGYVHQNGRLFSLTPKVLDLGYSFLSSFQVLELAQAPMERLVEEVKESSSLSILDGSEIVYVARVPTTRIMTISLALGSRLPAYPTSMGRVLLAGRPDSEIDEYIARTTLEPLTRYTTTDKDKFRAILLKTRDQGYALVDQELEEGVRSLAAPIHNGRGEVMAAMNVSCHATRAGMTRLREDFLPRLLATADEVSKLAGTHRVG